MVKVKKKKEEKKPTAIPKGKEGKVFSKGGKSFIIPEKEKKELEKQGDFGEISEEERLKKRGEEFAKTQIFKEEKLEQEELRAKKGEAEQIQEGLEEPEESGPIAKIKEFTDFFNLQERLNKEAEEKGIEPPQVSPTEPLLIGAGPAATGLFKSVNFGKGLFNIDKSQISTAFGIGKDGVYRNLKGTEKILTNYKANTKSAQVTGAWISKLAKTARNPIVVGNAIIASLGSYPFAGFIKEEALQTLDFALLSAKQSNDIQGELDSLQLKEEILSPDLWGQILNSIPYANVLKNLETYYDAAAKKLEIDKKNFNKRAIEMGLTQDLNT